MMSIWLNIFTIQIYHTDSIVSLFDSNHFDWLYMTFYGLPKNRPCIRWVLIKKF